jgi:hypothetical protein
MARRRGKRSGHSGKQQPHNCKPACPDQCDTTGGCRALNHGASTFWWRLVPPVLGTWRKIRKSGRLRGQPEKFRSNAVSCAMNCGALRCACTYATLRIGKPRPPGLQLWLVRLQRVYLCTLVWLTPIDWGLLVLGLVKWLVAACADAAAAGKRAAGATASIRSIASYARSNDF